MALGMEDVQAIYRFSIFVIIKCGHVAGLHGRLCVDIQ